MRTIAGTQSRTLFSFAAALLFVCAVPFSASAQVCSPTVNSSGLYLSKVEFNYSAQMENGQQYLTGNSGYSQTLGASAGTIKPYWGASIWYNIQNTSGTAKPYRIKLFADWNNDGDFNDNLEDNATGSGTVGANSSLGTGFAIIPPLHTSGTVRVRIAMAEGTTAPTPCGSFTGEVEDYVLTIAANAAPVLNTGTSPVLNNLLTTQTNSEGFTINQLLSSASLTTPMAADANDNGSGKVPRGLAIYSQSATNGTWQYRIGAGAWQSFGAVASGNALLLIGNGTSSLFQPGVKIRFVPTAAGTASFSYYLWDGTSAENGSYAAIGATGGSTAFSAATGTASLNVTASVTDGLPVVFSTAEEVIYATQLNGHTAQSVEPVNAFGTGDNFYSTDIALDAANTTAYWIAGGDADRIAKGQTDGSGVQTALTGGLVFSTGLAVSPDKIFYADYSPGIFSTNKDGSGLTALTGGAGQLNPTDIGDIGDIEYANNRIYFVYYSNSLHTYRIMSANTDGTGLTEEYATSLYIKGLAVSGTHLYWTAYNSDVVPNTFAVEKKSFSSGTVTTLATLQTDRLLNDLVADEANGAVYVIVSDGNSAGASELRRLSTSGGELTTVISLSGNVTSVAYNAPNITLPVRLVKWEAELLPNRTGQLRWTTGSEQQSSHFLIEKSSDGRSFSPVVTVAAKGAAGGASYSWNDSRLFSGNNYYRLSEVSVDGRKQDLGIRRLTLLNGSRLQLYPNPATGSTVTVNTGYPVTETLHYRLLDATGRIVLSGTISQQQQTLELGKLPAGYYLLSLSDGQHRQLTVN